MEREIPDVVHVLWTLMSVITQNGFGGERPPKREGQPWWKLSESE